VNVIAGYARTFVLLNQFDSERLPLGDFATTIHYEIREDEALAGIAALKADMLGRGEASALFRQPEGRQLCRHSRQYPAVLRR
jgi:hypothetical protein